MAQAEVKQRACISADEAMVRALLGLDDPEKCHEFDILPGGIVIPIGMLGLTLRRPDHYTGPVAFGYYRNFQMDGIEKLKGEVQPAERWEATGRHPEQVEVLAWQQPEIRKWFDQITQLAGIISERVAEHEGWDKEAVEYAELIDLVMNRVREAYMYRTQADRGHTVAVELLNGAARFTSRFSHPEGLVVSAKANRLDTQDGLYVGLNWNTKQLEQLAQSVHERLHLTITDDCIATAISMMAAIRSLQSKLGRQVIEKVTICASVGVQPAVEKLIVECLKCGIKPQNIKVICGVDAVGLTDEYYIKRAAGELRVDGSAYQGGEPFVFDMGLILTQATKVLENRGK